MKLYVSIDFQGHWGVPTAAVVLAKDEQHARQLLNAEFVKHGLSPSQANLCTLHRIVQTKPVAIILSDGDY